MKDWYVLQEHKQVGPLSWETLNQMAQNGSLNPSDKIWTEGMQEWQEAATIEALSLTTQHSSVTIKPSAPDSVQISGESKEVPNYLFWSLGATLLCFNPIALIPLYFSYQANKYKFSGKIETAREIAEKAKRWLIISFISWTLWLLFIGIIGQE